MDYTLRITCVFLQCMIFFSKRTNGLYLITDYFMDQSQSRAFLGGCGRTIRDSCAYINSHVNTFNLARYGPNRNCWMILDAGTADGARYKLNFLTWDLEPPVAGFCHHDYLELYDGPYGNTSQLFGRYCGNQRPNITGFPSQRYVTLRFATSKVAGFKGFRILATRVLPAPCGEGEFLCRADHQCIDSRLLCDGTNQCPDGQDERRCNPWQRFLGHIVTMGLAGMIGIGMAIFCLCLILCVFFSCCCTCCCCSQKHYPRGGPTKHPSHHQRTDHDFTVHKQVRRKRDGWAVVEELGSARDLKSSKDNLHREIILAPDHSNASRDDDSQKTIIINPSWTKA